MPDPMERLASALADRCRIDEPATLVVVEKWPAEVRRMLGP
jgi:hypothetical protein